MLLYPRRFISGPVSKKGPKQEKVSVKLWKGLADDLFCNSTQASFSNKKPLNNDARYSIKPADNYSAYSQTNCILHSRNVSSFVACHLDYLYISAIVSFTLGAYEVPTNRRKKNAAFGILHSCH